MVCARYNLIINLYYYLQFSINCSFYLFKIRWLTLLLLRITLSLSRSDYARWIVHNRLPNNSLTPLPTRLYGYLLPEILQIFRASLLTVKKYIYVSLLTIKFPRRSFIYDYVFDILGWIDREMYWVCAEYDKNYKSTLYKAVVISSLSSATNTIKI